MKYLYALVVLLGLTIPPSQACDVCGCGLNSYYAGIMPQFEKHLLGMRYRGTTFNSHLGQSSRFATTETFRSAELYGRFYLGEKWHLLATLPYNHNIQETADGTKTLSGLGDASVLANYQLLGATSTLNEKLVKHQFWVGAGLRLPTGKFEYEAGDLAQVANPNFQLGTGSIGYIGQATYTLRFTKWGFTGTGLAEYWHPNQNNYRFGKRFGGTGNLFYIHQVKKWGIMPNLGAQYAYAYRNQQSNEQIRESGGRLWQATAGLDVFRGSIVTGINYARPLSQNLAAGHIEAGPALTAHLSWLF